MYELLLSAIGDTPAPYAPMAFPFWDDAYISAQMLEAHLNPATETATRPHAFVARSADWIASLGGGMLLDLGCGPGIYAEAFAERGFTVTGVDLSVRSIAYAKASAARKGLAITYMRKNYLDLGFDGDFDVAVLIYCDYGVLSPENRRKVLQHVHRALRPGGLLILDAWTPKSLEGFKEGQHIEYVENGGFWTAETHAIISCNARYPDGVYLEQRHIITALALRTYNIWNKVYTQPELVGELAGAGFAQVDVYGDVAGAPVAGDSPTLCVVARK